MATDYNKNPQPLLYRGVYVKDVDESLTPIIFVHGINDSKEIWDINSLQHNIANVTKRRTYAVDLRCHGDTETKSYVEISTDLVIKDLHWFMESKKLRKAILAGNLLGGSIVCLFALNYPEKVEMLINVDGPLIIDQVQDPLRQMLGFMRIWETAVSQVSEEARTKEDAIKVAVKYVFSNFDHVEILEKRKVLESYNFPIKELEGGGYTVKQMMPKIYNYMDKVIAGEEFKISLKYSYSGPCLFLISNLSDLRKGIEHPDVKKMFPDIKWKKYKCQHVIMADPKFVQKKVLSFIKKKLVA